MISLCENCAYKMSDCKGNKDIEKVTCDYFKKPMVVNFKKMAEELSTAERQLADALEEIGRLTREKFGLKKENAELTQKNVYCSDDCYTCPNRCRPWQNGYNYNEHFKEKYEDMAEENSRLAHDNFELKKEIAELNRTIENWRTEAIQKWVDSRDEKSCSGCIHYDKEEWELPCVRCSRGNKDYWRGDNNDI